MRTKEIKIGTYAEWKAANDSVAEKILEKYRDINTDHEWYTFSVEDFCESIKKIGFDVDSDDVQFTGFWSQGDGASFTGSIDILEYLKGSKQLTRYSALRRAIDNGKVENYVGISRDSYHYSHENTCSIEYIDVYTDDITDLVDSQVAELQDDLEEKRLELSKELYRKLSDEYDYLCSDKALIETFVANEYDFDEDGDIVA